MLFKVTEGRLSQRKRARGERVRKGQKDGEEGSEKGSNNGRTKQGGVRYVQGMQEEDGDEDADEKRKREERIATYARIQVYI